MMIREPYIEKAGSESVWLPLPASLFLPFPAEIEWNTIKFRKKDEFHVTLLHVKNASIAANVPTEEILTFFDLFIEKHPIEFLSTVDDFRYMQENERKTIVVRCDVSNLDLLFTELNEKFNINVPKQPPHVTIYSLPDKPAIHILSEAIMESLERVSAQELERAFSNMHT